MRRNVLCCWLLTVGTLFGQTQAPAAAAKAPAAQTAKPAAAPAAKPAVPVAKPAAAVAKPAAAVAKPAPKPAGLTVDKVVEMKAAGLGDDIILSEVAKLPKGLTLTLDDKIKLGKAKVSDTVIKALEDPKLASQPAAAAPAPVAPVAPAPAPVAAAPAVVPVAAPTAPVINPANQKRVLALNEFEWATVKTAAQEVFKTNVDIGKGIRALLTNRLQKEGKIRLVERANMQKLMGEQDFAASNRVKKGTGAKIGNIIGADAMLFGDIVAFGRDDRDKRIKVGTIIPGAGVLGGLRIGKNTSKAVVVIAYRIADAETSEIIESGEARGESKRESKGLGGMLGVGGVLAGGSVDMTSSNFAETIIGEATIAACDELAAKLNAKIPGMPKRFVDLESRVAAVSGATLTISSGSNDSVAVGDKFEVFKILGETKDPVTKEVLDYQTQKMGDLVITSVRERVATGGYAGGPVEVGYLVRKVQ